MSHCFKWDYTAYISPPPRENERDKFLKKSKNSFEELLFQAEILKNGEIKEEDSAEFVKKMKENEDEILSSLRILIRNPRCITHYKPYSTAFNKIYQNKNLVPRLWYQTELFLLSFINDDKGRFVDFFSDNWNKARFCEIFPSESLSLALKQTDF